MRFRDYTSTVQETIRNSKRMKGVSTSELNSALNELYGTCDLRDYEKVYAGELHAIRQTKQTADRWIVEARMTAELQWYRDKRPFFNVYPAIEQKMNEISFALQMTELYLPYEVLEIRTESTTFLLVSRKEYFLFVIEFSDGTYQEFVVNKNQSLGQSEASPTLSIKGQLWRHTEMCTHSITQAQRNEMVRIAVGTCLLATNKDIVTPVLLNKHRREEMTPAEIAEYANKAINNTGRVGFDVGRELERMKATAHYRNGCFAKYYVGKDHPSYPPDSHARVVPVIKWRVGALVNKDNTPKVPTGFKD